MIRVPDDTLAQKFARVLPHLDERARRLVLGAEARMLGYGGIRRVARAAGMDEDTVARGAREIDQGAQVMGRVRAVGGGRKSAVEKDPEVVRVLLSLVEPDERGDPESPLRWTTKSPPVAVRSHDFPEKDAAKAVPYGIYDLAANAGWVSVGTDGDTAAFAVATLRRWWRAEGAARFPGAKELLITADAGSANGYRVRAWKKHLSDLAAETGLIITVCHFPPGTSKWNKIEHRLFSYLSINLRGRPITSHEVLVSTIGATTTAGPAVHAELDPGTYPTGEQVHDKVMKQLPVTGHAWHGEWNYEIRPAPEAAAPPPLDATFGMYEPGDKAPAWLAHPNLTGLEPPAWRELVARYTAYLDQHPATAMPNSSKPTVWTGTRKLPPTDRLLAAVLTRRWRAPRATLARLFGVAVPTLAPAIRQAAHDLDQLGHTVPHAGLTITSAQQLATIAGHELKPG